jgi:hypothetical protein
MVESFQMDSVLMPLYTEKFIYSYGKKLRGKEKTKRR